MVTHCLRSPVQKRRAGVATPAFQGDFPMARALAVNFDVDADFVPAPDPAPEARPPRGRAGHRSRPPSENARALQERLHEAYAVPATEAERELSPFIRLTVILGASSLLWGAIGLAVGAAL